MVVVLSHEENLAIFESGTGSWNEGEFGDGSGGSPFADGNGWGACHENYCSYTGNGFGDGFWSGNGAGNGGVKSDYGEGVGY